MRFSSAFNPAKVQIVVERWKDIPEKEGAPGALRGRIPGAFSATLRGRLLVQTLGGCDKVCGLRRSGGQHKLIAIILKE
jgi:hypothetical protein